MFQRIELLTIPRYRQTLQSSHFREMEQYSDRFIEKYRNILYEYSEKWILDPFHQWSRQWEYPYVLANIDKYLGEPASAANILDAGSGVTFFPYYLSESKPQWSVHCADYDISFNELHDTINRDAGTNVIFTQSDISELPYGSDYFEVVYCISVLEHTSNYEKIIREFARVIRNGGILILTIDISLDDRHDISIDNANVLLQKICHYFSTDAAEYLIPPDMDRNELFTTYYAYRCNRAFLPPRLIRMKPMDYIRALLTLKRPMPDIPFLGVYGAVFQISKCVAPMKSVV